MSPRSPHRTDPVRHGPAPRAGNRHATALAVLDATHAVLERGWLQQAERVVRDESGHLVVDGHGEVVRACLVGAVAEGARRHGGAVTSAVGPALDALWSAYASASRPTDGALGPVPSPVVRASRARELAAWNDAPARTRDQVLALVVLASRRVRCELDVLAGTPAADVPALA